MHDPYAPPGAALAHERVLDQGEALTLREAHLSHESALLALRWWFLFLGLLQIGAGALILFSGAILLSEAPSNMGPLEMAYLVFLFLVALFSTALGVLSLYSTWGISRFSAAARVPALINAAIQVLNFPFGMICGVYGLYLLLLPETTVVLSPRYRAARAATADLPIPRHPFGPALIALIALGIFGFVGLVAITIMAV